MEKSVFCLVENESQAQRIVADLESAGFSTDDISVLMADRRSQKGYVAPGMPSEPRKGTLGHEKATKAPEGATTGAISGGIIGGTIGMLAGIGALAIPGLGPFIAAGPLMGALAGSGVGGSAGLLIGALVGMGIPEYEAKRYQDSLKSGGILVSVHTENSNEVDRASDVMKRAGGKDISSSMEKSKK